jgi:hypothetical protein
MAKKLDKPTNENDDTDHEASDTSFNPAELDGPVPNSMPNGPDPFDPSALRLSQNLNASLGVKKALVAVPVRKPHNSWFVRVHPDETYRLQTAVVEMKEDRETYLVAQTLWPALATEALFKPKLLATAINRQGDVFLWELNLPRSNGRTDEWSRTALAAMNMAIDGWVRLSANMSLGAYDVFQASGKLSEPDWPQVPFRELLRVAFKNRYIDSLDHPVLRKLRGEI